eukprot:m51a1_g11709 hypothetical protein (128) ;mRNA; r:61504-61949
MHISRSLVAGIVVAAALFVSLALADCSDQQDQDAFAKHHDDMHQIISDCANKCWGKQDCCTACIGSGAGLTDSCAACFGADCACMKDKCMKECILDQKSPVCLKCHADRCEPALYKCANVPNGTIPQ